MPIFDPFKQDAEPQLSPWMQALPTLGHSPKQQSEELRELPPLAGIQQNPSGKQGETIKENVKETKQASEKEPNAEHAAVPFGDMFGEVPDFTKYQKQDKLPEKYVPPEGADAKELQYSPFGLPLTPDAWAMQTKIDGGKLHYLYDKMKDSPDWQKQFAGKKPDEIAKDPTFNQTVIDTYLKEAAKLGDKAAFMGEFLPTETGDQKAALGKVWEHAKTGDPGALRDMQATKTVSQIRLGNAQIAEQFQQSDGGKGKEMFSLVVPYSNTVENIINNDGKPKDGADQFAQYMNHCAQRRNGRNSRGLASTGNGRGTARAHRAGGFAGQKMGASTLAATTFCAEMGASTLATTTFCAEMGVSTLAVTSFCAEMGVSTLAVTTFCAEMGVSTLATTTFCAEMGVSTLATTTFCAEMGVSTLAVTSFCAEMGV